ncbi:hypothetical protein [Thermus sp. 93170]|uniref:hypothetical protein n=1 Tax=Thermus sp. 93170 TaxID=1046939 RepID=UPI003F41E1A1
MIRGVHLAQVVDVHPKDYEVSVYLPYLPPGLLGKGLRVKLGGRMQRPKAGDFYIPKVGDWGLVAFPLEDARSGVWLLSLPDWAWHVIPEELFEQDPNAALVHYPGGQWRVEYGDGTTEAVWPDGTLVQVIRHDPPKSWIGRILDRFRTKRPTEKEWTGRTREPYKPPPGPVSYVYFRHASGTEVHVAQDGSVQVKTPTGHVLILDEGEWSGEKQVVLRHQAGHHLTMTPTAVALNSVGNLTITATGNVVIDGAAIAIG